LQVGGKALRGMNGQRGARFQGFPLLLVTHVFGIQLIRRRPQLDAHDE